MKLTSTLIFFILGMLAGIFSRGMDIYTQIIGNIFSELSIWVLLAV